MSASNVQKLAGVLKVLVTITFACNLIALALVPGLAMMRGFQELLGLSPYERYWELPVRGGVLFPRCWKWVWFAGVYDVVLTIFLLFCGACTAVILWQARRVLNTVLAGNPFRKENGASLRRAAVCCYLISAAALLRVLWGLTYYGSIAPLLTYNALFVPIFFMGGLLCLVMSALFCQAAELKAENDLTI